MEIKPGIYKHLKGGIIEVLHVVHHSETLEDMVVYVALYECRSFGLGSLWVRPLKMFLEDVEVDGKKVPRFKYIGADEKETA